jgi:hypothetical protein
MKTFIRTITVFVALNLVMTSSTPAQNALEEAPQVGPAVILATQTQKTPSFPEPLPIPPEPPPPIALIASTWPQQYRGIGTVLVIPTAQMKPQDLAAITEDMNVMSRILDKKLGRAPRISAISTIRLFSGDSQATEAIYLQGFGTLFLIKVSYPLAPPLEVQEAKAEKDVDPVWTQTKQEIYMPESTRTVGIRMGDRPAEDYVEEYNAEKVEDLKRTLIKALKHAANIRNLGPDDLVTVVVSGSEPRIAVRHIHVSSRSSGIVTSRTPSWPSEMTSSAPTFLAIRAKKSDIDAFSKDELNYDQFRQRTQIFTY